MSNPDPTVPSAEKPPAVPSLSENATPEEKDAHWLKHVYQGDHQRQLTLRAVLIGGVLGMFMSISNLYTTLKIGWSFGVAITACVLSYVLWNGFRRASGGRLTPMSMLENNCMQSTASAAGYSTGGTVGTAFGALFLIQGVHQPWTVLAPFVLFTAMLGVFVAIPMKRQMINYEQLKFPSGVAAAETLRSLYAHGGEAVRKAWSLIIALGAGAVVGLLRGYPMLVGAMAEAKRAPEWLVKLAGKFHIPEEIHIKLGAQGKALAGYSFEPSVLLIGAGMITGLRVSLSMLLASSVLYLGVTPWLDRVQTQRAGQAGFVRPLTRLDVVITNFPAAQSNAVFAAVLAANPALNTNAAQRLLTGLSRPVDRLTKKGEADALQAKLEAAGAQVMQRPEPVISPTRWALWGGTAIMVFSSLVALALQWRTVARAFRFVKGGGGRDDAISRIEVPTSWFVAGMIPITIGLVIVLKLSFDVSIALGLLAVAASFVVSLVCCRATGETDTTPIGPMGKVIQLLYALLPGAKGNISINLMSAGATSAAGGSSADLLTDLKSGYLLGANPRRQFLAQVFGVLFGTLAIVPAWYLMAPDKETLEQRFPVMPAASMWRAVAEILTKGANALNELPTFAKEAIVVGALLGVLLPVAAKFLGKRERFLPSAMGLGLGLVIPFSSALAFAIGATITEIWERRSRPKADIYNVPVASGFIAGEGIILAIIAILSTLVGFMALK